MRSRILQRPFFLVGKNRQAMVQKKLGRDSVSGLSAAAEASVIDDALAAGSAVRFEDRSDFAESEDRPSVPDRRE